MNRFLEPYGAELYLWDAYRLIVTQAGIWDFFDRAYKAETPDIDHETLQTRLRHNVSDPRAFHEQDPSTWPTHSTGAAMDLTLRARTDGTSLPMGAVFDQMDASAHTDFYERALQAGEIPPAEPRLLNRRLLYHAMEASGFVSYPKEFWRYDCGNQMAQWNRAKLFGAPLEPAWYGYTPLPHGTARDQM